MMDPVVGYDADGPVLAARYESLRAEDVHAAFLGLLPRGSDLLALDVGAGSGRDAAWLRGLGFEVVAVEPARGMREAAARCPESRWTPAALTLRCASGSRGAT